MLFSRKQQEYIRKANSRWNVQVGAVRSGKSFVDIAYVIPERLRAVHDKDGLNVILGVSKESVERNVLQPMREIYTSALVGTINSRNIAQVCGVPVYCLGAEKASQVAKIQGASIKYCYGDEIAKWNREVFVMLASRLDKEYSKFDGACNPEYPTHWLKQFIDRDDIDKYVQRYTIFDNPFLPKSTIRNLCREYYGTVYYDRYILGLWALAEGLIYPMHDEALVSELPPGDPDDWALSIDYGTLNAFGAILWALYGDTWYAVKEYYYSGRDTGAQKTDQEYADDICDFVRPVREWTIRAAARGAVYGDFEIPTIIDPSAASFITLLSRREGFRVQSANNDVLDGLRCTARAMRNGYIKILDKNNHMIEEMQGYVWDDSSEEDRPIKVADHLCVTGDTVVMTCNGEKPIKDLVGETGVVWSLNTKTLQPEKKQFRNVMCTQRKVKILKLTLKDGKVIRCTEDHPVLTQRGYVPVKYLNATDKIIEISTHLPNTVRSIGIESIEFDGYEDVYNMEVEDNHNFAVNGGIITHNCDAMRYFVKTMHIADEPEPYNPIWNKY